MTIWAAIRLVVTVEPERCNYLDVQCEVGCFASFIGKWKKRSWTSDRGIVRSLRGCEPHDGRMGASEVKGASESKRLNHSQ